MSVLPWEAAIRTSYDAVAEHYAMRVSTGVEVGPRAALAWLAEFIRHDDAPVLDAGCGPGHMTAWLNGIGIDARGIDLSPAMVDAARKAHPGLTFDVGSMTDPPLPSSSIGSVVAWYSIDNLPDEAVRQAFRGFRRILRPQGIVMIGFKLGDQSTLDPVIEGEQVEIMVHRRPIDRVAGWLSDEGFTVMSLITNRPNRPPSGGVIIAQRS